MRYTILCKFDPNVGWRIHSVTDILTTSISVVTRNGIKLLAIPVVRKTRAGHFCNPVKLVIQVVKELNCPIVLARPHAQLLEQEPEEEQTFASDPRIMLRKIQQTCVSISM
jgi:hypothetical protein